jgi:hypothetical protein
LISLKAVDVKRQKVRFGVLREETLQANWVTEKTLLRPRTENILADLS